jgi:predicted signal transduction protein with EAL and GGDEF domain
VLDPTKEASDTLRHADVAMYSAKRVGKGRFVHFTAEMGVALDLAESTERRHSLAEVLTLTASLAT